MIRFSAFLVVVAVGLLVAGVVTSKLMLVYLAIAVSGVALLALGIGAAVKRRELFGYPQAAPSDVGAQEPVPVLVPQAPTAFGSAPQQTAQQPTVQQQTVQQPTVQQPAPQQPAPQPTAQQQLTAQQAQPEQGYPRPASAPPRTTQPRPAEAGNRPAETLSPPEAAAAAWQSAVPPTGVFPAVRPAAQAPDTRAAEHSGAGASRSPRPPDPQRRPAAFTPRPDAGPESPALKAPEPTRA
ncbi:MAG TPA: hypothetical protein VHN16_11940, partial [Streptosporangiaceae bacterium]|nr:hypothetical protein [Streptosporangiaceae bacterium]